VTTEHFVEKVSFWIAWAMWWLQISLKRRHFESLEQCDDWTCRWKGLILNRLSNVMTTNLTEKASFWITWTTWRLNISLKRSHFESLEQCDDYKSHWKGVILNHSNNVTTEHFVEKVLFWIKWTMWRLNISLKRCHLKSLEQWEDTRTCWKRLILNHLNNVTTEHLVEKVSFFNHFSNVMIIPRGISDNF